MKTKIALTQSANPEVWEQDWLPRFSSEIRAAGLEKAELVSDPQDADMVVLFESCAAGASEIPPSYSVQGKPVVCVNYADVPHGFLPGIYTSLERYRFDPEIHISWPHHNLPNDMLERSPAVPIDAADLLFSFAGSCSHPIRRTLFDRFERLRGPWQVTEVKRWYNHTGGEKSSYIDQLGRSRFVLCPHGIASYSHRIIETLAFGRVPVVIADDWVPFSIPESGYYVRIKERDAAHAAEILLDLDQGYGSYRDQALRVYSEYFHPKRRQAVMMGRLVDLFLEKGDALLPETACKRWKNHAFRRANGWTLTQRVERRFGRLVKRAFA